MMWLDELKADMSEIHGVVEQWRELRFKLDEAQAKFEAAKKAYDTFCADMASAFRHNGLEQLRLEDGLTVKIVQGVRASIAKDKDKRQGVAEWLRAHEAGQLVSSQLIVMPSAKEKLDKIGVAYDEEVSMNTNSVKAWVKGEMEVGNVKQEDLPKGLSWYMYDEVQIC